MKKEEKPVFLKLVWVVGIIFLLNVAIFVYNYSTNKGITGFSIREVRGAEKVPLNTKLFLVVEWALLLSTLFFIYFKDQRKLGMKRELSDIDLKKFSKRQGTDLDTLYNILQDKKQLKISSIAKLFNIDKKTAMEWGKILEAGNLVMIDYPTARGPVVKILER